MVPFPSGTVTLVFTDIEGSSSLWEKHHAAFTPVLEAHNRLMRAAAAKFNGREVKTEGDAFFLVFAEAREAVAFAIEAQLALRWFEWSAVIPELQELRVRIGMHTGEPILSAHPDGTADYFGPPVNRAARVSGAGYGGQILISSATHERTKHERAKHERTKADDFEFEDLGRQYLKGVGDEILWQVNHPELPSRFPPLKTVAAARHNLPAAQTPFIGRQQSIGQWTQLLLQEETRLLTLVAFGGQGKTRAALEIARNCIGEFNDGVWWVEVEAARDNETLIARIAHELRLHLLPQPSIDEQIFEFIKQREILLVIDNTEQIPDAGKIIHELLRVAPKVKCLVTTRRALEIRLEKVVSIPPLAIDEGVELFVERSSSRAANFAWNDEQGKNDEQRKEVAALCQALEGVPLAIELAASRSAVLSPSEILERLGERFRLLQTKAPDLPPRQRALRGAIDWSYDLLNAEEQELLAKLSVFDGGFTLDAAESVADDFEALEGVAQLQRHSFLQSEQSGKSGSRKRFSMSASVHAYSKEKFEELASRDQFRQLHTTFFLKFTEQTAGFLRTHDEAAALEKFWAERANVVAALEWLVALGATEPGHRLSLAQAEVLYLLGFWEAANTSLRQGLALLDLDASLEPARPTFLLKLARLAHDTGKAEVALDHAQSALDLAGKTGNRNAEAEAFNLLGLLAGDDGRVDEAKAFFHKALAACSPSDKTGFANGLHNLALLATRVQDWKEASKLYHQALLHWREAKDARGEAATLGELGTLAFFKGEFDNAESLYRQSLSISRTLGNQLGIGLMLHNLGEIAFETGNPARSLALFHHSRHIFQEIGSPFVGASQPYFDQLQTQLGEKFQTVLFEARAIGWETLVV